MAEKRNNLEPVKVSIPGLNEPIENKDDKTKKKIKYCDSMLDKDRSADKTGNKVLYVGNLNPDTDSEGLEEIFKRSGPIVSCEVVRDSSGKSRKFAFIEFQKEQDCEDACFRMNNCLIDDRRIRVDFKRVSGATGRKSYRNFKSDAAKQSSNSAESSHYSRSRSSSLKSSHSESFKHAISTSDLKSRKRSLSRKYSCDKEAVTKPCSSDTEKSLAQPCYKSSRSHVSAYTKHKPS